MAFAPAHLKYFADFIHTELGIVYSQENYFQLEKRLIEIAKVLNLPNEEALIKKAQEGIHGPFKQLLLDISTNNETSFFRDSKVFSAIENEIVPALRRRSPTSTQFRIWCAASSFGQEPYSLAILLAELSRREPLTPRFEILGTDISEAALKRAQEGIYSQLEVQRGLTPALLSKYFKKSADDLWAVNPEIRASVHFKKQNLLDSFAPLGDFDLVLCRNVLIYQKDDRKKEIVERMTKRITPGGFFLLGAAESLMGVSLEFKQLIKDGAVYFQKENKV